jgi:DNA-binding transcriptional regulator YiaG
VHEYNMDTLGAPFRVNVIDAVSISIDPSTGEEEVSVPDVIGLINAVVRSRVEHARKLNGREISFVRKSLGVRAKLLAGFLGMSPEHFSRCEVGSKVMSGASEKLFRLFAYLGTYCEDPTDLLNKCADPDFIRAAMEKVRPRKIQKVMDGFLRVFLEMKIQAVYDPEDVLHFRFVRRPSDDRRAGPGDDGEWDDELDLAV